MKNLIDKRLAISDCNFKPVSTTYLIGSDIIPNYPFFFFEQTSHIIFFNILPSLTAQLPNVLRSLASRIGRLTWNWSYIRLVIEPTPLLTNVLSVFASRQNPTCSPLTRTETRSLQTKYQKVANGSHHFLQGFNFLIHQQRTSKIKDHTSDIRHWDWLAWGVPAGSTCFLAR